MRSPSLACGVRERFLQDVLSNATNRHILGRWDSLRLPDGWLVAGCLFQTVWNLRSGLPPCSHIKDYDIFYFDGSDLSAEGEALIQARAEGVLGNLGVPIEVKNQARVHRWYEEHFGHPYPRLTRATDGIDRFLIPATCVGIRPAGDGYEIYAPNGLDLVYEGVLTPNPLVDHRDLFLAKARSYCDRWPWLHEHREPELTRI